MMRILNEVGIEKFQQYLVAGAVDDVPLHMLVQDEFSSEHPHLKKECPVVAKGSNKEDLARAISSILEGKDLSNWLYDRNLWASFALSYFELICPREADGSRKVGMQYRYIPPAGRSYKDYYRHLIRTPVWLYIRYGELAKYLLVSMPNKGGDFIEQLASRQEIVTNRAIMELAGILYFDHSRNRIKVGSTSSKSAGGLRRFVTMMQQFELTYDLHAMGYEELMELLPKEFLPWMPESSSLAKA